MTPRVSCIMPTRDRRRFLPRALACFLAQDYSNREMLILDDGDDRVADLVPDDPRVRYFELNQGCALGAKRNLAVERATGDLIVHWDDDDWSASERITRQVRTLVEQNAEVCGMRRILFHDLTSDQVWLYEYPRAQQRAWLVGGSLLYTREFWAQTPFPAIQVGEDTRFLFGRPAPRLAEVTDLALYIASIHPANTSIRNTTGAYWTRWPGDVYAVPGYTAPVSHGGARRVKLNLGCCDALLADYVNVDLVPGPGVECVDLRQPWPWPSDSIHHVRAWDIVEHLPDKILTMNELWRVLVNGGTVEIAVPTTDGPGAFQDPTHVSFWNRRSFLYYEAGNPYRDRFAQHYGITARFRTVRERTEHSQDGPRLTILLEAVKT